MAIISAIELLSVSPRGRFLAAGLSESKIEIWDLETGQKTAELETILDFGGKRMAIGRDAAICIAGSWKEGLAAYDIASKELLWHRKDIMKVQRVSVSADVSRVYCSLAGEKLLVLDMRSGATTDIFPGIRRIVDSPFSNHALHITSRNGPSYLVKGDRQFEIERLSFSVLDARFSPTSLCISEGRGPSRCFDLRTGTQLWRFDPQADSHVGTLGYRAENDCFYGTLSNYQEGGPRILVQLNSGICHRIGSLGNAWAAQFCLDGKAIITSGGQLFNTADCTLIRTLSFPQREFAETSI